MSWTAPILVNFCSFTHISISFSCELVLTWHWLSICLSISVFRFADLSKFLSCELKAVWHYGSISPHSFHFSIWSPLPCFSFAICVLPRCFTVRNSSHIKRHWLRDQTGHRCNHPGLTTGLLKVPFCPLPLAAMGMSGTWGIWNTLSSLYSLPHLIFLLFNTVPCCIFTVPGMTLNTSSLNRAAWSSSCCSCLAL